MMAAHTPEDEWFIEVDVTIETVLEETARYKIDRRDFLEWSKDGITNKALKDYLRAGEVWEVCASIHGAATGTPDVIDCDVTGVKQVEPESSAPSQKFAVDESGEVTTRGFIDAMGLDEPRTGDEENRHE